jgi:hypothetical protein
MVVHNGGLAMREEFQGGRLTEAKDLYQLGMQGLRKRKDVFRELTLMSFDMSIENVEAFKEFLIIDGQKTGTTNGSALQYIRAVLSIRHAGCSWFTQCAYDKVRDSGKASHVRQFQVLLSWCKDNEYCIDSLDPRKVKDWAGHLKAGKSRIPYNTSSLLGLEEQSPYGSIGTPLQILLPESLDKSVKEIVRSGRYSSANEYIQKLIEQDMRKRS